MCGQLLLEPIRQRLDPSLKYIEVLVLGISERVRVPAGAHGVGDVQREVQDVLAQAVVIHLRLRGVEVEPDLSLPLDRQHPEQQVLESEVVQLLPTFFW